MRALRPPGMHAAMRLQLMSPAASRRAPHQATRAAGRAEVAPRRWHGTLKKTAPAAAGSEATHHTGAATEFEFADPSSEEKTTILFGVKDGTGALNGVLGLFVEHGIDMTHIQSRPARRDMEAFEFEVDFVGSQFQSDVQATLQPPPLPPPPLLSPHLPSAAAALAHSCCEPYIRVAAHSCNPLCAAQKFLAKLKASVGELTVLDQQQVRRRALRTHTAHRNGASCGRQSVGAWAARDCGRRVTPLRACRCVPATGPLVPSVGD